MFVVKICIVFIGFLTTAQTLDYTLLLADEGAVPCDDREDKFLDSFVDYSNMNWEQIDDETIMLNGYVIFLTEIDVSLHLHVQAQRYDSGKWIETPFQKDQNDICLTVYNKNEVWHDFVTELKNNSQCPPEKGTRFDFKEKKISTLFKDLSPGLDGTYRALVKLFMAEQLFLCMNIEGDLSKKLEETIYSKQLSNIPV